MAAALDALAAELGEADRQERIELLIDLAKSLPPLPDRLADHKDATHRVEECQSPVYLFVELEPGDRVAIFADAPIEAPTVRGFVSLLVEGLNGATIEEVLSVPNDLIDRVGLPEILGMLRVRGLGGVLRRLKAEVTRAGDREGLGASRRKRAGDGFESNLRDHRPMADFVKVTDRAALPPGGKLLSEVDGRPIAVFNVDGQYYAIDDVCTHDGGPLAEGELDGAEIQCPRHGARFDVRTGKALCFPAFEPVATHRVEVRGDDDVLVALDD